MKVIYNGIRFTSDEIVAAAKEEAPHIIGLSILSGSHVSLAGEIVKKLADAGLSDVKVVAGGIIPPEDEVRLKAAGVSARTMPVMTRPFFRLRTETAYSLGMTALGSRIFSSK